MDAEEATKPYDSMEDTLAHIHNVQEWIFKVVAELQKRALTHDASKLDYPEKDIFDEVTPKLRGLTYGSKEYFGQLAGMKPALDHHYSHNRHHPEGHPNGVDGMDLVDLLEMLCDWKAATERHADGDIEKSLEINTKRFNLSPQLLSILKNTVVNMNMKNMKKGKGDA